MSNEKKHLKKPPAEPLDSIVRRRVHVLFEQAFLALKDDEPRAIHYISLARKLSSRHRIPLGRALKQKFCPACNRPLRAGYNLKVRLRPRTKQAEYACACGAKRYFLYSGKNRASPHSERASEPT